MAEPQPPTVTPGSAAASASTENPALKPGSKDDAKAAAALESLDARGEDADGPAKSGDSAALAGAMKDLKVDGSGKVLAKEAPRKVKIDAKDVAVVVEHCVVNKAKATEMLKASEGDLRGALGAWVEGRA